MASDLAAGAGASSVSIEQAAVSSLLSATLLAFAGGALDAFLYLGHGRVFAGAMTGNAVLCGIALLGDNQAEAVRHALPLLAFFCGVWLSEWVQGRLRVHAVTVGLICEIAGLLTASVLPRDFPDLLFVFWIALLAAYQIASFRKADHYSYNSTFITGDLRTAVVGLYHALAPSTRREGLQQARALGTIVATFLAGAIAGALLSPRFGNRTLWLPVLALIAVLTLTLWRLRQTGSPAAMQMP